MLEITSAVFGYAEGLGDRIITAPLTLTVTANEILGVVGPSGVGKSTLLKSLAGLLPPLSGHVSLPTVFRRSGPTWYEPQSPVFLPFRTVLQQALAARELDRALTAQDVKAAGEVLTEMGLADDATSDPIRISGGMRRRVALARGLLSERPLLLLDEPLAELDLGTRRNAEGVIAERASQSVIFVSHDIDSVVAIADRVLALQAPLPARATLLSIADRFRQSGRDPEARRQDPAFTGTVAWVQQHLWDQWDA